MGILADACSAVLKAGQGRNLRRLAVSASWPSSCGHSRGSARGYDKGMTHAISKSSQVVDFLFESVREREKTVQTSLKDFDVAFDHFLKYLMAPSRSLDGRFDLG